MKTVLALGASLFSLTALADCKVFVPEKEFRHSSGLGIIFDFTAALHPKGYVEVQSEETADSILTWEGNEKITRFFHYAETRFRIVNRRGELLVESENTLRCLTQECAIGNYSKSFGRTYRDFAKVLPKCEIP